MSKEGEEEEEEEEEDGVWPDCSAERRARRRASLAFRAWVNASIDMTAVGDRSMRGSKGRWAKDQAVRWQ